MLTVSVKLPNYNVYSARPPNSEEDKRIAKLAQRAQKGDYDEGIFSAFLRKP